MKWFSGKKGNNSYIKEAIDNLPSGICFFDSNEILVLCNHKMDLLVQAFSRQDLQILSDLHNMLNAPKAGVEILQEGNRLFALDGIVWKFTITDILLENDEKYTQVVATDVTELYQKQNELRADTEKQKEISEQLSEIQANVVELAREEETLRLRMSIHDDIGQSVVMSKRLLQTNQLVDNLNMSLWKDAINILHRDTVHLQMKGSLEKFMRDAEALGIKVIFHGDTPENEMEKEILISAMRECMTNTVRHAGGNEIQVTVKNGKNEFQIVITNNGEAPKKRIVEGSGLSALHTLVVSERGTMLTQSEPVFQLQIMLPRGGKING